MERDVRCPRSEVRRRRRHAAASACWLRRLLLLVLFTASMTGLVSAPAAAAERYAVIVSGASGGEAYAKRYDEWRTKLVTLLTDRFGFPQAHVFALGEKPDGRVQLASRDNVRRTLSALNGRVRARDLLLVVLLGHGTFDGLSAKFNLVGPDLDASEWSALLKPITGRLIVVNTTGSSFPFLATLSAKGRVVITATDSAAGRYDTVFAEYFVKAMEQAAAEGGRDATVSIWQVFTTASAGVRRHYEQRGLLPVEHALLDDAGDGFGKDAEQPGTDPSFAQNVYLGADAGDAATDPATRELTERRDDLMAKIEKLKAQKGSMSPADYEAQLEKLLVDLARVTRDLKGKGQ